ncbi:saccharopine dehydrogenase NADP-binding domain-containing protein [Bosea sp. 2KB_26]|uniref:saccharopine dehydrogenase family protein n=1 Tax=Bosea sp. 2KB_26 TaxID=3237475 RepID=UPI003F9055D0
MTRLEEKHRPFSVVIVGGGRIGSALAVLLREAPEFDVVIVDPTEPARVNARTLNLRLVDIDPGNASKLDSLLARSDAVVAALPSSATPPIAAAARRSGVHYLDLSDDTPGLDAVRREAGSASSCFVPQCGVSPGLISPLVLDLLSKGAMHGEVNVRIGTLPRHSTNRLGYGLTWDVDALLREYLQPSAALINRKVTSLPPLSEQEQLRLDDSLYEVFVSGNIPLSLCTYLEGRVDSLVSRTIRYPGHLDHMKFLLDDLKLRHRVDLLRNLFLNALPEIDDDRLLIFITAAGMRNGRRIEHRFARHVVPTTIGAVSLSAMRRTAASHVAAVLDLIREGRLGGAGLIAQEDIPMDALRANRFLSWFFDGITTASAAHSSMETAS